MPLSKRQDTLRYPIERSLLSWACTSVLFFFQAEDGIRDLTVTGVQTCALAVTVWLCALFLGALSLFVLEVIGAAIFSDELKGEEGLFLKKQLLRIRGDNAYSAAERFRLLGQAGFCWLCCGLGTVILFQYIGSQFLSKSGFLINATRAVGAA